MNAITEMHKKTVRKKYGGSIFCRTANPNLVLSLFLRNSSVDMQFSVDKQRNTDDSEDVQSFVFSFLHSVGKLMYGKFAENCKNNYIQRIIRLM